MTPVRKISMLASVACIWLTAATTAIGGTVETRHLLASDAKGGLSDGQLTALATDAERTLAAVLDYWSVDAGLDRFDRIRVIFDSPRQGDYTSVFFWRSEGRRRYRTVLVLGFEEPRQMLAHKLSSAVLLQRDKLIRNMLGILTEIKLGNPATFPMCGFDVDDWAGLFLADNTAIPLADLGPDDQSWGMGEGRDGRIVVHDRKRQHMAYAEAGSFAAFLERRYGREKLKALHQAASGGAARLWREVFGADLPELEVAWRLATIEHFKARPEQAAALTTLVAADPTTACTVARQLAPRANPRR